MKIFFRFLFTAFLLFSCTTTGREWVPEVISVDEATINKMTKLLEDGDYGSVLQDADTLKREYPDLVGEEILSLEAEALKLLESNYQQALEEQAWEDAVKYLSELSVFSSVDKADGEEIPVEDGASEDWTIGELLLKQADSLSAESPIPSLIIYQKSLKYKEPGVDELLRFGMLAEEEGSREILRLIAGKMEAIGADVPESFTNYLKSNDTPVDFMDGTVTIWVNRGIKLEDGMGYADRVIGSGFFIDKRGYLITNHHVIESEVDPEYSGFSRLYVRLPGEQGDKIPAEVVGWDPVFDIALLKTVMEPEYVFSFKNEEEYVPGEKIYAIGSPGGLERTITSGIVSATGRRLLEVGETIQVDVPINSGNSGGPLLNTSGELIGVVFAGIEQFEGVNFAIPSDWISGRIPTFYKGGRQVIPWMGTAFYEGNTGLEAIYTYPASPSERAGIIPGDILLSINGKDVASLSEAQRILVSLDGQDLIEAEWKRGEDTYRSIINLEERPDLPLEKALEIDSRERLMLPFFGMDVESTGKNNYVIKKVYPGMIAEETGLSANDPMTIYDWLYEEEYEVILMQIRIKKRKAGFMESIVQLASFVSLPNFL